MENPKWQMPSLQPSSFRPHPLLYLVVSQTTGPGDRVTIQKIIVNPKFYLSSFALGDKPALLEYLHTRDVYNTTLNIPYPYTEGDADWWLNRRMESLKTQAKETTFALRNDREKLIGAVGAEGVNPGISHRAEIGYWLAKPFWGQGIMTDALRAFVSYAFDELHLLRLTAHVFENNLRSARVLEKNGFQLEGKLRKHFIKDGKLIDARLYGLLREDLTF